MQRYDLYLPRPVFTHGQIYVALSRARDTDSLRFFLEPAKAKDSYSMDIIIYESLSPKILNIIKSCIIDFYSADK